MQERGWGRLCAGGRLVLVRCGSRKVDRADGCSSADVVSHAVEAAVSEQGYQRMTESPPRGRALSAARRRLSVGYTYEGMLTRLRVPVRTATARPPVSRTRPNAAAMPIPKSSHANDVDAEAEATGVDACSVLP